MGQLNAEVFLKEIDLENKIKKNKKVISKAIKSYNKKYAKEYGTYDFHETYIKKDNKIVLKNEKHHRDDFLGSFERNHLEQEIFHLFYQELVYNHLKQTHLKKDAYSSSSMHIMKRTLFHAFLRECIKIDVDYEVYKITNINVEVEFQTASFASFVVDQKFERYSEHYIHNLNTYFWDKDLKNIPQFIRLTGLEQLFPAAPTQGNQVSIGREIKKMETSLVTEK